MLGRRKRGEKSPRVFTREGQWARRQCWACGLLRWRERLNMRGEPAVGRLRPGWHPGSQNLKGAHLKAEEGMNSRDPVKAKLAETV